MKDQGANRDTQIEWENILSHLRAEVGETAFQSWLRPMRLRGFDSGVVQISVPTRFMRDWAVAHYLDRLRNLWNAIDGSVHSVEVSIQPELSSEEEMKKTSVAAAAKAATSAAETARAKRCGCGVVSWRAGARRRRAPRLAPRAGRAAPAKIGRRRALGRPSRAFDAGRS